MKPIEKIRTILLEELDLLRDSGDLERAKAVSGLSAQTIYSIRMEVENKKLELELGKADESVKGWMDKDFTIISRIREK